MYKPFFTLFEAVIFLFMLICGETVLAQEPDNGQKVRIAVLPFADTNTSARQQGYGEAVSGMLMTELINDRIFQVVERSEINRMMQEMAFQLSGAVDPQTAKRMGEMLGVDILVFGTVAKFGTLVESDIRLVETESGEALMAEHENCSDEANIRTMVGNLSKKIQARFQQRSLETVNIYSMPSGAEVFLDEQLIGQTPLSDKATQGVHTLQVVKEGYAPWQQQVEIKAGENHIDAILETGVTVKPDTDNKKKKSNTLYYLLGGAAVAAGATYFLTSGGDNGTEEKAKNSSVTINVTFP